MSEKTIGTLLPTNATRLVGAELQPVIVHVAGADRSELEDIVELKGNCTYIAVFDQSGPGPASCYVGMTGCGQDRPRLGTHLAHPQLASSVFVIADRANNLTKPQAAVLERFFFAKLSEVTDWRMRCSRPRAGGVGLHTFSNLMSFGGEALCLMQKHHGLFGDTPLGRLKMSPRAFEPILYDYFQGEPTGEEMILDAFGVKAFGIDMGANGFVISAGSTMRAEVVPSAAGLTAARREELLYNGHLRSLTNGLLEVRRALWRPSPTSAAKLVTGSSASAGDWHPQNRPRLRLV